MTLTTPDVIGLLALALAVTAYSVWAFIRMDRVLRDPDHPYHDDYKEIIAESETRSTLDYWFRYD